MSNPQNILAKYRTYAYHHILIACDNEAAARFIRESNRLSAFRDLRSQRPITIDDKEKLVPLTTDDKVQIGSYVVILNGMINSNFIVRDVEWFTSTAASTDQQDKFTSIAVEGKMTVEEPRGVIFMNELNRACDLLETDPTGVIWLLKTIFVGHGIKNGSEFSDYIVNLRPLEFVIYDVTGTFDVTGGVYEISFVGANNGAARLPQYSRVAKEISFTPGDDTLAGSMQTLIDLMNKKSKKNHACVIEALQKAYDFVEPEKLNRFRVVEYRIVLEDPYVGSNKDKSEYIIDGWTDLEKDKTTGQGIFKFGIKSTVEQAIRSIMNRCSRVQKDLTEGDENGIRYSFKIHSEITMLGKDTKHSLLDSNSEQDIILVVYRVRRFAEVTNQVVKNVLNTPGKRGVDDEVTQATIDENLITFDYFFTGKNIDIIDFDLKMEMGLTFLQTIASTNTIGTGTNLIIGTKKDNVKLLATPENPKDAANVNSKGETEPKILIRSKTPIFPSTNVNNVFEKNIRGALDSTLFSAMLSRHAALESVEAKVTIHGNPYLMSQTNRRGSDRQRRVDPPEKGDPSIILQSWDFIPGLVKLNIFMPATTDTPSSTATFNREQFWYNGYYYLYGINHMFSDGQFTQELHMTSLPNDSFVINNQQADISECGVEKTKKVTENETHEITAADAMALNISDSDTVSTLGIKED